MTTRKSRPPAFVLLAQIAYYRMLRAFYDSRHPLANPFTLAATVISVVLVVTVAATAGPLK